MIDYINNKAMHKSEKFIRLSIRRLKNSKTLKTHSLKLSHQFFLLFVKTVVVKREKHFKKQNVIIRKAWFK